MAKEFRKQQPFLRKARSQSMVDHRQEQQQGYARSSSTSASPTEYGSSTESDSTLECSNVGASAGAAGHTRQELLQYLRMEAEQTRLRLQAIEQLERDIHAREDGDSDSIDGDPEELISPYLQGSLSSPSEEQLTYPQSPSFSTIRHTTRKQPRTARSFTGQNNQTGVIRHRYSADQLPPPPQQEPRQRQQQNQNPRHSQFSQQLYKRDHSAAQSTISGNCSTEFEKSGAMTSRPQYNKQASSSGSTSNSNITNLAGTKSRKIPEAKSRRQSYDGSSRVFSSSSPCSSLSPPISPLSPTIGDGLHESNRIHQSFSSATFRIHAQSNQIQDWNPELESPSPKDEDYSSEDSLLYKCFGEQQEDLRDVTLSDIMKRNLVMLSDSDEYDVEESQIEPESGDNELHVADMTFSNRTFQFMSKLEQDFDTNIQGIPSLLTETIPENDFADMTFLTCTDPTETTDTQTMLVVKNTSESHVQSNQQDRHQQSTQLPPAHVPKELALDDFLKSLPPLPHSPNSKQPPSDIQKQNLQSVTTAITSPTLTSSSSGNSGRIVPLPTPIITSRERCQQIKHEKSRSSNSQQQHQRRSPLRYSRSSAAIIGEMSSPLTSASPLASTPWSNITTPLNSRGASCRDLPSEVSTSSSVYSSAKEEFAQDHQFSVEHPGETRSMSKNTNILPTSLSQKPSRSISRLMSLSPRNQPLDMIIVRPANATQASGGLSPRSPLISATSENSNKSIGSSWSWPWPKSKLHSKDNSSMISLNDQQSQSKSIRARIRSTLQSPDEVQIKSRSMSSLIKHQNGWLGFQALDVKLVASGRYHIVVITQSNQVYSCWETNNDSVRDNLPEKASEQAIEETLGRDTRIQVQSSFVQDTTYQPGMVRTQDDTSDIWPSNIIKVACSDNATFLLTECGDLWGWGFFEPSSRPIQICKKRIKDVVCGRNHILILSFSGDVISWGANEHGQLGRPCPQATTTTPTTSQGPSFDQKVGFDLSPYFIENLPTSIIGIGAGKLSSFAWDDEKLYGWGDNMFGQLGRDVSPGAAINLKQNQLKGTAGSSISRTLDISERQDIVTLPREIPLHWKGRSIKQIQGGERHTIILTLSGLVIAMGNDDFGQLGINSSTSAVNAATITSPDTPTSSSSSSPTSLSSSDSSTWHESNTSSRVDLAESTIAKPKTRLFPALVRIGSGIKEIRCGDFHTVTCSDSGQMFTWGRGYDGIISIQDLRNQEQSIPQSSGGVGGCMELTGATKTMMSATSLVERTRRVAAISTMRDGISIALVYND
ncbi:E3 ISG15--protein ligase herc5 [Haplosporangium sp. Z 27]|nr:E3 ISG15--protein ligase herc5 [Haplosporangium sp. Z 27]